MCPFVCIWVIMTACLCVFKVGVFVFFFWAPAHYRLLLQLKPHVVCFHNTVKDPLYTDSTPPFLFHLKFHWCIQASQWQHVSIPALNPLSTKQTSLLSCKLACWDYRFTHLERVFCGVKAFWKLFFKSCFVVGGREALW